MESDRVNHPVVQPKTKQEKMLMQLEKERPDLLKKVVRGELSANKAFLLAGIQSQRIQARRSLIQSLL